MGVVRQLGVQDTVKAARLIHIAAERVLEFLGSGGVEVVRLSLHGAETTHLPHKPAQGLPMLLRADGVRDLVVLVEPGDNVQQDGTGFENLDLLAVLELVGQSRDTAVGVDLEVPRLLVLVLEYTDGTDLDGEKRIVRVLRRNYESGWSAYLVRKPELLKNDGCLQAIRSSLRVKSDVGLGGHLSNDRIANTFQYK